MGFARGIGLRFRSAGETVEDLVQVSYLGLVSAVNRYDLDREVPFEAFAAPTIRGELLRHLRDNSKPVHVPRGLQDQARRVSRMESDLTALLGRPPDVAEMAAALAEEPEAIREALGVRDATATVSLDPVGGVSDDGQVRPTVAEIGYESVEMRDRMSRAASLLTREERLAVTLRFGADLSQDEIARKLGVSQMTVSRLLRRSFEKLRAGMEDSDGAELPSIDRVIGRREQGLESEAA